MTPREQRKSVMITARMKDDAAWRDISIRNVSSHGVMIQLPNPPKRGSYVEIRRNTLVIVGRVMWTNGAACGLRTHEALSLPTMGELEATQPGHHPDAPGGIERRKRARPPAELAEAAVVRGRRMQFATIGLAAAAGVAALSLFAYQVLSAPAQAIGAALS